MTIMKERQRTHHWVRSNEDIVEKDGAGTPFCDETRFTCCAYDLQTRLPQFVARPRASLQIGVFCWKQIELPDQGLKKSNTTSRGRHGDDVMAHCHVETQLRKSGETCALERPYTCEHVCGGNDFGGKRTVVETG